MRHNHDGWSAAATDPAWTNRPAWRHSEVPQGVHLNRISKRKSIVNDNFKASRRQFLKVGGAGDVNRHHPRAGPVRKRDGCAKCGHARRHEVPGQADRRQESAPPACNSSRARLRRLWVAARFSPATPRFLPTAPAWAGRRNPPSNRRIRRCEGKKAQLRLFSCRAPAFTRRFVPN